ncbi:hypothetical protein WAX86_07000 [Photobacterium damselae subsp. damselae]|uniref:hypothetical protein n=1 Tax=Photobacterium damselae TaxID=38293 RepID=UPI00311B41C2
MNVDGWLIILIFLVGMVALLGFLITKTKGFGRFSTSTFLILLVCIIASLMFAADKIEVGLISNLFFSIIGFAGGLFTVKRNEASTEDN